MNLFIRRLRQFRKAPKIISEPHPIDVIVKTNMSRRGTVDPIHKAGKGHMYFIFPTTRVKNQRTTTTIAVSSKCCLR